MTAADISFYVIAAFTLLGAILSVTTRKIFRSAVWLLFSLGGIAALYFWLDMQFLAAVQIIVYIGGIVVLIIFSIFLTEYAGADLPPAFRSRKVSAFLLSLAGFLFLTLLVTSAAYFPSSNPFMHDIASIGRKMLSTAAGGFALPFEAVSVLLLAAMIGCIAIAIRKNPGKA